MNCLIFCFFALLILYSLFPTRIAEYEVKIDDEAFVRFVKGPAKFDQFFTQKGVENKQIKETISQIYGTHLGILNHLAKNWNCSKAKNVEKWSQIRMEKCEEYKEKLNILYKYLFNVYVLNTKVKPYKFYDPLFCPEYNNYYYYVPICKFVKELTTIFEIFFCNMETINDDKQYRKLPFRDFFFFYEKEYDYWKAFGEEKWKKLFNRKEYESKVAKFEKIMEKMFQNVMEKAHFKKGLKREDKMAKDASSTSAEDAVPLSDLLSKLLSYSMHEIEEEAFVQFVKEGMNEEIKFMDILTNISLRQSEDEVKKNKKIKQFETHLVLLFLMKKNWHFVHLKVTECNEIGHYLDILYEYLLRIFSGIMAVRPSFRLSKEFSGDDDKCLLLNVVDLLNKISKRCFNIQSLSLYKPEHYSLENSELKLLNENELNYKEIADNENLYSEYTFQEIVVQMALDASSSAEKQQNDTINTIEGLFRHAFDQELAQLLGKWTKMASKAKAEWKTMKIGEAYDEKVSIYKDSFSVLLASPFFKPK